MEDKISSGFFAVDMSIIDKIANSTNLPNPLFSYLILANHTAGGTHEKPHRFTTAGCSAICRKVGLSRTKSQEAIAWLIENSYIIKAEEPYTYELLLSNSPSWVYLGHTLIEGTGTTTRLPPLAELYDSVSISQGINAKLARKDSLYVLIQCYQNLSLKDFGGIDPRFVHQKWITQSDSTDIDGLHFMKISDSTEPISLDCKISKVRFVHGLKNLLKTGLLHRSIIVWDGNPLNDRDAEPIYNLYIFNRKNRRPTLSHAINRIVAQYRAEIGEITPYEINQTIKENAASCSFWVVGEDVYPLGIYQPCFYPPTSEIVGALKSEIAQTERWVEMINEIHLIY